MHVDQSVLFLQPVGCFVGLDVDVLVEIDDWFDRDLGVGLPHHSRICATLIGNRVF